MASIARPCDGCRKYHRVEVLPGTPFACPECAKPWGKTTALETVFESCPVCQCSQFYIQKDFNQALGCLIMLIGIVLVPFTYGLSLPVFAGFDWLLHKRVATMAVCYRCLSEFRGFKIPEHLKTFMHHIGVKYDKSK